MNLVFRTFSRKMHSQTRSKFRGCLLGSLMGDCLGAPYEGQQITNGDKIIIKRYFDKMEDPSFRGLKAHQFFWYLSTALITFKARSKSTPMTQP